MKAVWIDHPIEFGEMKVSQVPVPGVKPGWVLIKVKAFGLNHSELVLRRHEISAAYIQKPVIPGIECVGIIENPSDSRFQKGDYVVALMGGMGRSFNGGYAEYALLPEHHVFKVNHMMDWTKLGAIPETFYTAYGSLFQSLRLEKNDTILIRGGTSALGLGAIQLAKATGCQVIATTRKVERCEFLKEVGADAAILDHDDLFGQLKKAYPQRINKVLELVSGQSIPSLQGILADGAVVCVTGQLGNTKQTTDLIKGIPNGCYVTSFHSNYPRQEDIDNIFKMIEDHNIEPIIGRTFSLDEIALAHEYLEKHYVMGKLVVTTEQ